MRGIVRTHWIALALGLSMAACSEDAEVADPAGMGAGQPEFPGEPTQPLEVLENMPGGPISDSTTTTEAEREPGVDAEGVGM